MTGPALALALLAATAAGPAETPRAATRAESWSAERLQKRAELAPPELEGWHDFLLWYEDHPLHVKLLDKGFAGLRALIGGLPSGSGFAGGLGWHAGRDSHLALFSVDARYSTKQFTELAAGLAFPGPLADSPLEARILARYRDFPELDFFGLGNESDVDSRTSYGIEERFYGLELAVEPSRRLRLEASGGFLDIEAGPGAAEPSLEALFAPAGVSGFGARPELQVYSGLAELRLFDSVHPPAGVMFAAGIQRVEDRDLERFSFLKLTGELQVHLPLGPRSRRLVLRARTSHSMPDRGNRVPFFLMETLGGAKGLRGFDEYRFRDRRNLLINLEYRWEVWHYLDFALFGDAGKVFASGDDLDLRDLHYGYGFGFRIHVPFGGTILRIDVAQSSETTALHISGGPSF